MTDEWVKKVDIDILECAKKMVIIRKQLRPKETGKYEYLILWTPFRIIALMLNMNFGQADGTLYKLSWIPLIYYMAFEGTIFN